MRIDDLPRTSLGTFPTPLVRARRFSQELGGPTVWLKRDDLTGLAFGGNKVRKLEFLVADALGKGANVLITTGAAQSNHARLTAAAARHAGLESVLVLRRQGPTHTQGNLLIDQLLGADLRMVEPGEDVDAAMQAVAEELRRQGKVPYVIPVGGSNALGAVGYADGAREIQRQAEAQGFKVDCVICASGSGGTQGGLVLGTRVFGLPFAVWGMSVSATRENLQKTVARVATEGADLLGAPPIRPEEIVAYDDYIGPRYGIPTRDGIDAIRWLARSEAVMLDPVYTGKAMAGLVDHIRQGRLRRGQTVVFVHTGGTPALFVHNRRLVQGG